jgi:hypothetical protein
MELVKRNRGGEHEPVAEREGIHEVVESHLTSERRETGMEWVKKKNRGGEDEPVAERECIHDFGCKAFEVRTTSKGDGIF